MKITKPILYDDPLPEDCTGTKRSAVTIKSTKRADP